MESARANEHRLSTLPLPRFLQHNQVFLFLQIGLKLTPFCFIVATDELLKPSADQIFTITLSKFHYPKWYYEFPPGTRSG